ETPLAPRVAPPDAPAPSAPAPDVVSAAPAAAEPPAAESTEVRGPKVLGRIDLRKATGPPPTQGWRPATPPQEGAPTGAGDLRGDAPRKKKGRKVIQKTDMFGVAERDFGRGSKRPQKRRALPGKELKKTEITLPRASKRVVRISEVITVADL